MKNIAIIYGSSTGNTKDVADKIAKKLSGNDVFVADVSNVKLDELSKYSNFILGTSTWGLGDLQDDWDSALQDFAKIDLNGKTVAFFGLGDSASYPDTFVDGMGILYESLKDKGCKLTGSVPTDGYTYDYSKAVVDNNFVGVALDVDNEDNLTDGRLDAWIASLNLE